MKAHIEKGLVDSETLSLLLKKRQEGSVDFILVDVREDSEYSKSHIEGVDMIKSSALWTKDLVEIFKDKTIIILMCICISFNSQKYST